MTPTSSRRGDTRPLSRDWPTSLAVQGLFGNGSDTVIRLNTAERVTILTGPNGSGKTRLLFILRAALALDWPALAREPFDSLELTHGNGRVLRVGRVERGGDVALDIEVVKGSRQLASAPMELSIDPAVDVQIPNFMERIGDDLWEDQRDGELIDTEELAVRFGRLRRPGEPIASQLTMPPAESLAQIQALVGPAAAPTLIETKRLDTRPTRARSRAGNARSHRPDRIYDYVEEIQRQVQAADDRYKRVAQTADSQFVAKALDRAHEPPSTEELLREYEDLSSLHSELQKTGLAEESPAVELPKRLTKPEQHIFAVFLEDWRLKLEPLVPVHERLQALQRIVGTKLKNKRLYLDQSGLLAIESIPQGNALQFSQLSSGEQHLLALFAMLLFSANEGSVVLIDEPEISLHAEWKHAFVGDIQEVAERSNLEFVIATHSTGIINRQWDLVQAI